MSKRKLPPHGGHQKVDARNKLPTVKAKEVYWWAHGQARAVTEAFKAIEAGLDSRAIPDTEALLALALQKGVPVDVAFRPRQQSPARLQSVRMTLNERPDLLAYSDDGSIDSAILSSELDGFDIPASPEPNRNRWEASRAPAYHPPEWPTFAALRDWSNRKNSRTWPEWMVKRVIVARINKNLPAPQNVTEIPLETFLHKAYTRGAWRAVGAQWERIGFQHGREAAWGMRLLKLIYVCDEISRLEARPRVDIDVAGTFFDFDLSTIEGLAGLKFSGVPEGPLLHRAAVEFYAGVARAAGKKYRWMGTAHAVRRLSYARGIALGMRAYLADADGRFLPGWRERLEQERRHEIKTAVAIEAMVRPRITYKPPHKSLAAVRELAKV